MKPLDMLCVALDLVLDLYFVYEISRIQNHSVEVYLSTHLLWRFTPHHDDHHDVSMQAPASPEAFTQPQPHLRALHTRP